MGLMAGKNEIILVYASWAPSAGACGESGLHWRLGLESQANDATCNLCTAGPDNHLTIATMKKIYALLVLAGVFNAAAAADIVGNPKAAAAKVEQCIGCHGISGYKGTFPEVYRVPMIAGQSAKYLESALNAYKKGDRKHPTMRGIAASMSDQDIADVSAYYAQMSPATVQK
jgi:cytochrome c553